ncbi:sugar ABC transporter substrate-binding protein [Microbacterium sp. E-13]|uniref:sugar ABC transporter substrate-binding protein n=1 Tax=Microbacterium sp. E-13 TaxID=3404048 RepID=UPI003CF176BF
MANSIEGLIGTPGQMGFSRRDLLRFAGIGGLAFAMGGSLVACAPGEAGGTAATPGSKEFNVLNSYFTLDNVYYDAYNKGSQAAMGDLNLKYFQAVSNNDPNAQLSQLSSVGLQGISGVTMIASNNGIQPELVRSLQNQKVYTANMWNNAPWVTPLDIGDYYLTFGVVNGPATFQSVAELLFRKLDGKGKVIQIDGIRGASINDERLAGVAAAAKKFPGIEMVPEQAGGWSRTDARPVIDALLVQHPDVAGIISHNDDMTVAIVEALKTKGLAGKVVVVSGDGVPEGLALIESGDVYATLCTHPAWLGGYFISRIFDALNGWKPTPAERMMHWGCFSVNTPEAAKRYGEIMYADPAPYDWTRMSRVLNPDTWDPQNLIGPMDPSLYWAYQESSKPAGYELPAAYQGQKWETDKANTLALYESHFKSDPLAEVRELCTDGAGDIVV